MGNDVIEKAKLFIADDKNRFEEIIKTIEKTKNDLDKDKQETANLKIEAMELKNEAERQRNKINNEAQKEIEKAKEKAAQMLRKASMQVNELLDQLNEIKKNNSNSQEDRAKLKAALKDLEKTVDPINKKDNTDYKLPRKLKVGDSVLIFDIDKEAEVIEEEDSSGKVLVQAGIIKTRVPVSNLRLIENKPKAKATNIGGRRNVKSIADREASLSIDLRGKTALEAIIELDTFIDNAMLYNVNQITIIHGKGTGVLRKEIQSHLKRHPSIKSYRLGVFGEGEAGVTIAELK